MYTISHGGFCHERMATSSIHPTLLCLAMIPWRRSLCAGNYRSLNHRISITASKTLAHSANHPVRSTQLEVISRTTRELFEHNRRSFTVRSRNMSLLSVELTAPNGRKYQQPTGLFVNNEWVKSSTGKTLVSINPT